MSRSPTKLRLGFLLLGGLCVAAGGCGERLSMAPVEGKVLYHGQPLEFGSVMFQADQGAPARGQIAADGTFRLAIHGVGDGAVIGTNRVRITCTEKQRSGAPRPDATQEPGVGKSLIPKKYSSFNTSGLRVEVKSVNEPFVFELTD